MTYQNRWIGYEEGHQEIELDLLEVHSPGHNDVICETYRWVTDFYIRIDSKAFRVEYKGRGTNIFWEDFFRRIRWRVLRPSIRSALRMLKKRIRHEEWIPHG